VHACVHRDECSYVYEYMCLYYIYQKKSVVFHTCNRTCPTENANVSPVFVFLGEIFAILYKSIRIAQGA
jgi:hypothetical protein